MRKTWRGQQGEGEGGGGSRGRNGGERKKGQKSRKTEVNKEDEMTAAKGRGWNTVGSEKAGETRKWGENELMRAEGGRPKDT